MRVQGPSCAFLLGENVNNLKVWYQGTFVHRYDRSHEESSSLPWMLTPFSMENPEKIFIPALLNHLRPCNLCAGASCSKYFKRQPIWLRCLLNPSSLALVPLVAPLPQRPHISWCPLSTSTHLYPFHWNLYQDFKEYPSSVSSSLGRLSKASVLSYWWMIIFIALCLMFAFKFDFKTKV